ncbi:MAG: hypothetical protein J6Q22_10140 [Prevotella sp.]|nr:hypothetical protein [Prevotella sp.]
MIVTAYNALEVEAKDILEEVKSINETCYNILQLLHITVTNIHMAYRLCDRIRDIIAKNNYYREDLTGLIEIKGKFLYLKVDGGLPRIKIQEKYGGTLTMRPWSLTVSPIVNKGDRNFRA